jgi:hypothetical protein
MYAVSNGKNWEVWRKGDEITLKEIKSNKQIHEFLKSQNDPNPIDERKRMDGRKR